MVLVLGRLIEGMLFIVRELELNKYNSFIISYNGGKIINMVNENVEVD